MACESESNGASDALRDAVAIGLRMQLPDDVIERYATGKWEVAKYGGETVDDRGQRWVTVRMPIGSPRPTREDPIIAIALVPAAEGYSVARLELPLAVAGQYGIAMSDPEPRGFAIDQGQRELARTVDTTS